MQSRQLICYLLAQIILACCYRQVLAETGVKETGNKHTASNNNKETNKAIKPHGFFMKLQNTTANANNTIKPESPTKYLPAEFVLKGRSADTADTVAYNKQPYELLKQQIKVAMSKALKTGANETHTLGAKGTYGNMHKLGDHDVTDTEDYDDASDCLPNTCKDSQESRRDIDLGKSLILQKPLPNIFEQPHPSSSYVPQISANGNNKHYQHHESNNYSTQIRINTPDGYGLGVSTQKQNNFEGKDATKSEQLSELANQRRNQNNDDRIKSSDPFYQFLQSMARQQYGYANQNSATNPNAYDTSKAQPNRTLNLSSNIRKTGMSLLNKAKPTGNSKSQDKQQKSNNKPLYNSNHTKAIILSSLRHDSHNDIRSLSFNQSLNMPNTALVSNLSHSNLDKETLSPLSTTSGYNKKYKTISSSVQYVPTPLVDLVFKYSIGMAKHLNVGNDLADHLEQMLNVRNDNQAKV